MKDVVRHSEQNSDEVIKMDERVEEVSAISRIRPVRKLSFTGHRRERRELKYQLSQYQTARKPKGNNLISKKIANGLDTADTDSVLDSLDLIGDVKKRIAFDRAIIMGD